MRQIGSFLEGLLQRLRRIPVVRVVVALVLGVLTLQAAVITVLMLVTKRRALRLPPGGFPHPELPELAIGDNHLQIYSYGEHLYEAMLNAIDRARETIYFETYLWKDDVIGRAF
ncbi:MAG TPA: hypothetical protein VFW76_12360, partial [Ktedonobacterales bacterium]|nr:hypothetical protein [Ktedonobacterales bacterium]